MWSDGLRVLYLHGFASSPQSLKARFFREKFDQLGLRLEIPDLAEGDFKQLTVTRQLRYLESLLKNEMCVLIGSSLGGYLAAWYASRNPEVQRVLLLAPAFGFYQLWVAELGPERLAAWQREGTLPVFHYQQGREIPLSYRFLEDARELSPFPDMQQPGLIFHGNRDSVVPIEQSLAFVRIHPGTQLVRVESGHELTDVLESVWYQAEKFLLEGVR